MNAPVPATDKSVRPARVLHRLGAFILDSLVLGLIGWSIGLFASERLIALGGWGRLVGFLIAMIYFVPQYSAFSGGRTLGKRALKLRVVGQNGEPVGLGRAALRYLVIGVPWFLNGAMLPASLMNSWVFAPMSLMIFGTGLGVIYLVLFNRRTGQGLHDLIAGTWVLSEGRVVPDAKVAPLHRYVLTLIFVLAALIPFVLASTVAKRQPFVQLLAAHQAVEATGEVFSSTINKGVSYYSGSGKIRSLGMAAFVKHWPDAPEAEARKLAGVMLTAYGSTQDIDQVGVRLVYGYDIGIASWSRSATFRWPAASLRSDLTPKP